jgi:hypothetical protein
LTNVASKSKVKVLGFTPAAHTRARAAVRPASTRARRSPSMASNNRHAVGWEATGPNNAGWSRSGARSDE